MSSCTAPSNNEENIFKPSCDAWNERKNTNQQVLPDTDCSWTDKNGPILVIGHPAAASLAWLWYYRMSAMRPLPSASFKSCSLHHGTQEAWWTVQRLHGNFPRSNTAYCRLCNCSNPAFCIPYLVEISIPVVEWMFKTCFIVDWNYESFTLSERQSMHADAYLIPIIGSL